MVLVNTSNYWLLLRTLRTKQLSLVTALAALAKHNAPGHRCSRLCMGNCIIHKIQSRYWKATKGINTFNRQKHTMNILRKIKQLSYPASNIKLYKLVCIDSIGVEIYYLLSIKIYHTVNRLRSPLSLGHSVARSLGFQRCEWHTDTKHQHLQVCFANKKA